MRLINKTTDKYGYSYLFEIDNINVWVDAHINDQKDLIVDWNKYIFYDNNAHDQAVKKIQENLDNFELVDSFINNDLSNETK